MWTASMLSRSVMMSDGYVPSMGGIGRCGVLGDSLRGNPPLCVHTYCTSLR